MFWHLKFDYQIEYNKLWTFICSIWSIYLWIYLYNSQFQQALSILESQPHRNYSKAFQIALDKGLWHVSTSEMNWKFNFEKKNPQKSEKWAIQLFSPHFRLAWTNDESIEEQRLLCPPNLVLNTVATLSSLNLNPNIETPFPSLLSMKSTRIYYC